MTSWKTQIIKRFDTAAPHYGRHSHIQQRVAQSLLKFLPETATNILEIGCGDGALTRLLAQKYPKSQLTATDISTAMLAKAQQNLKAHRAINWQQMDGENINSAGRYDLIVSNMTVQWFEDWSAAAQQWQQHLTENGLIVTTRPGVDNFKEWAQSLQDVGLPDNGLLKPQATTARLLQQECLPTQYPSTLSFLKAMRKTGATTANKAHKPLSTSQFKQACAHCDEHYNSTLTWHILYESLTKS